MSVVNRKNSAYPGQFCLSDRKNEAPIYVNALKSHKFKVIKLTSREFCSMILTGTA